MSGAYLSANLHKQVLIELLLVSVLYFAFCPLGPPRIIFLVCILVLQVWSEISETVYHFFCHPKQFYLYEWRAEALEWRLVT